MHLTKFSDYALRVVLNRANPMQNLIAVIGYANWN
jgi:hypothetical protein